MSGREETTPLLSYGRGTQVPHRFTEMPPSQPEEPSKPPGSLFDSPESSPLLQKSQQREGGLPVSTATAYILGLLGVAPLVTLPNAIAYCGWSGFVVFLVLVVVEVFTAVLLARAWLMLELFWPRDALLQRRNPLGALAEKVGGEYFRRFVSLLQNLAIFGAAIPFLLLATETLQRLVMDVSGVDWSVCEWLFVTTAVMTPLLCLGTPKDLRAVTWLGVVSMVAVTVLTLTSLFLETRQERREYTTPPTIPSWSSLAYCYGAVAMQFDIHPVMLTVQMDMNERYRLPRALIAACAVGAALILVVAGAVFAVRGSSVTSNLLHSLPGGPVLDATLGVVVVQVIVCLVLGINTLFQNLEATLNVPDECGWRRACVRACVVVAVLLVAESVPHFGPTMELVGGLFATPFIFIFPPAFHAIIKYKACGRVSARDVVVAGNLTVLGLVGCVAATVESLAEIARLRNRTPSCFVDFFTSPQDSEP